MTGTVLAIKYIQPVGEEQQVTLFGDQFSFNIMSKTVAPVGVMIANNPVKRTKQRDAAKQFAADKRVVVMLVIDVI